MQTEDLSAVVMAFNEQENIPDLLACLKGTSDIVVVDHCSTDKTADLARSYGARVITTPNIRDTVTTEDITAFKDRFGFLPSFTAGQLIADGGAERNQGATYARNDWVLSIDCDERVTWDLPALRAILPTADQISCRFIHSHNPDGSPSCEFSQCKLYRKSKSKWIGRVHEVVVGENVRSVHASNMQIDHWQKPKSHRRNYLPDLEYDLLHQPSLRTTFYLAREYFYYQEHEKAIRMFQEYLKTAWWTPEICEAYLHLARCCWLLSRGQEARNYCLQAIGINPNFKAALLQMSEMVWPEQAGAWKKFAAVASNEGVLFKS